jgi:hypothetical protein
MSNKVFIPLSDDLIYEHPELILGPITAFDPASRQDSGSTGRKLRNDHLLSAAGRSVRKTKEIADRPIG